MASTFRMGLSTGDDRGSVFSTLVELLRRKIQDE